MTESKELISQRNRGGDISDVKLIRKSYLPLKFVKSVCKINASVWDYDHPGRTRFIYWLGILAGVTSENKWNYNYLDLAIDKNGECIGYMMAYLSNKHKKCHPILILIHFLACFLLSFSKDGREILQWRRLYRFHQDASVQIGKASLMGKDYKKVSEGISIAIYPIYHKFGIYRNMTKRLLENLKGFYIFHTSTECVYQAHEAFGFKKIFECPHFYPEKETTFIMYGQKSFLKV